MEKLKKERRPVRASVTRTANEAEQELAVVPQNMINLMEKSEKLDELLDKLTELDLKIIDGMLDAGCTDEQQDEEYLANEEYRKKIRIAKLKLDKVLKATSPTPSEYSTASAGQQRNFKLPKIELIKFSGELKDWLGFWAQFQKIHEDPSLHPSDKFHYLSQAMQNGTEAKELVKSYPASADNYPKVIESLKEHYGNTNLLLQVYIRELLSLVIINVTGKDKMPLEKMYLKIESHLRALATLNMATADPATWLFPLVESSLPEEVLRAWQRSPLSKKDGNLEVPKKTVLDYLMEFIKSEVQSEQRINIARAGFSSELDSKQSKVNSRNKKMRDEVPTSQSLYSDSKSTACLFCGKSNHVSAECYKAAKMSSEDRNKKIKESQACFKCFKRGHRYNDCRGKMICSNCKGNHYTMMCRGKLNSSEQVQSVAEEVKKLQVDSTIVNACQSARDGLVLMKTVRANLVNSDRHKLSVRILFDEGSNRSFIKTSTAANMMCPVIEEFEFETTLFGGNKTVSRLKKKFKVSIQSLDRKFQGEFPFINEDIICGNCPVVPKGPWLKELSDQKIYVNDISSDNPEIEILIGSNLWGQFMTGRMFKLKNGLIAVESVFGWTLSGEISSKPSSSNCTSAVISMLTQGEKSLSEMWELETIGIKDSAEKLSQEDHDQKVKDDFKKNIARALDGRYEVKLPWVDESIHIPDNKRVCEKRLASTTRKLLSEDLFVTYDKIFQGWEEEGLIEKLHVHSNLGHYLPHHRVLKPESKTTPVRPVFDASCKVGSNPSLNDILERGPNMLELIPSILLRFREKEVGVISDIRKAFQMISVAEADKNFQKFLWWENGKPDVMIEYRHNRVVFGLNCSPFILAAVLEYHFDNVHEADQGVVQKLKTSIYVDNCVLSFDTQQEYKEFKKVSIKILADARMDLCQWESNKEDSEEDMTSVLGLHWKKNTDTLSCKIVTRDVYEKINKRNVLSIVAQVFDPIGFTCPATIQVKMMLQSSWNKELTWDAEWGEEDQDKFKRWYREISALNQIEIPRVAVGTNVRAIELHLFTDASQDAYAAVVYARVEFKSEVRVQLLLSKSRLAPLCKERKSKKSPEKTISKRITIPRLELLGCLIGARLLKSVRQSLGYEDAITHCWSDSTTALAWIWRKQDWGTFVGNRVKEINDIIDPNQWRHVTGESNPADLPSRGCSPQQLKESRWWEGPSWLYKDQEEWPKSVDLPNENDVLQEVKKSAVVNVNLEVKEPRFSSYRKNVNTAAWIRRFLNNARAVKGKRNRDPNLSKEEMWEAEKDIVREIQAIHFGDGLKGTNLNISKSEDGLYHIKTRLSYKNDEHLFKFPIVLPGKDPLVQQLIEFTHRSHCHAGTQFVLNQLRERYWILQGRRTVDQVIRKCVTCRRYSSKNVTCDPAPLPALRIDTSQSCFQTTGVDLAGPIVLKGGKKSWVVIYTCAVYRAVYLDIVDSLSSEEFLNSLHKFTCIVGRPTTIFSDNGTNFVGAESLMARLNWKKVSDKLHVQNIVWKFNPPTASWWGGWWERLIRSLKDLLRRMIGTAKLTRKELEVCMAEISQVMNNRPLTTLTENSMDLIPLTPSMFMRDLPLTGLPELTLLTSKDIQEAHRKISDLKAALKGRFRKEYLANLIQREAELPNVELKIGDVVLVGSDNRKRFEWPLGRIIQLFPGKDGKFRVAKVRTAKGMLERPLQRLYPLEFPSASLETKDVHETWNKKTARALEDPKGIKKNICEDLEKGDLKTARVEGLPKGTEKNLCEDKDEGIVTRFGRKVKKPCRYDHWCQ